MNNGTVIVLAGIVLLLCINTTISFRAWPFFSHHLHTHLPQFQFSHRRITSIIESLLLLDKSGGSDNSNLQFYDVLVERTELASGRPRLDIYLSNKYPEHSRSQVISMCELGLVKVNGKCQSKSYKVAANDYIQFGIQRKTISTVKPEDIKLDIIYEDENLLAINKPKGMVVHPAIGWPNGTFVNALLFHLGITEVEDWFHNKSNSTKDSRREGPNNQFLETRRSLESSDNVLSVDLPETPEAARTSPLFLRPGIVHRLDKGTTGVLLAAKSPLALTKLSNLFAERLVRKTYLAVCVGHPGDTTIALPLIRSPKNRQIITVCRGKEANARLAVTHTRTLCFDGKLSLVLIRIETGRTHQIRVHLQHRRTPILGDATYGNHAWNKLFASNHGIDRPLLHAYETQFVHPFTGELLILKAPLPEDFRRVIDKISKQAIFPSPPSLRLSNADLDWLKIYDNKTHLLLGSTLVRGRREPPVIEMVPWDMGENLQDDMEEMESASFGEFEDEDEEEFEEDEDYEYLDEGNDDEYDCELEGDLGNLRMYVPIDRIRRDDASGSQWFRKNLPEDEETFR